LGDIFADESGHPGVGRDGVRLAIKNTLRKLDNASRLILQMELKALKRERMRWKESGRESGREGERRESNMEACGKINQW
jgi:hypothetical protein